MEDRRLPNTRQRPHEPLNSFNHNRTYLLARGNVDVTALGKDLAEMDTTATFQPLQPLADNDVQGYLRHVHEQTLISTIEESRRETQAEFYRIMEERTHRDWEEQKKQIFQELGGRMLSLADSTSKADLRKSVSSIVSGSRPPTFAAGPSSQAKMRAFGVVVGELNAARLRGTSYPIVNSLAKVCSDIQSEVHINSTSCALTNENKGAQSSRRHIPGISENSRRTCLFALR